MVLQSFAPANLFYEMSLLIASYILLLEITNRWRATSTLLISFADDYLGKETGNVNVINKEIVLIMVVIWFLFGFEIVNL